MTNKRPIIPIFAGPTGVGKTDFAHRYADLTGSEIVNADSINVYRGFDIGSAKPSKEEQAHYHYHLIDVRNPNEEFTVGDFVRQSEALVLDSIGKSKPICFVGGTGFYLKALVRGLWQVPASQPDLRLQLENEEHSLGIQVLYDRLKAVDPISADRISIRDRYRVIRALEIITATGRSLTDIEAEHKKIIDARLYEFRLFVFDRQAADLESRIKTRIEKMFQMGWLNEVRMLRSTWQKDDQVIRPLLSVGYREIVTALDSWLNHDPDQKQTLKLNEEIFVATRQLIKRQRTWFRGQRESIPLILKSDEDMMPTILAKTGCTGCQF